MPIERLNSDERMSSVDAEYTCERTLPRRECFLIEMDQSLPWKGLIALMEPYYRKVKVIVFYIKHMSKVLIDHLRRK
ncbi:hypothetical protein SAMN03159306_04070 [Pseudomonas sp. NFACC48-1]|nr:hypothetical protein SAMN03159405_01919 [Pseudomonas sp. NFACC44-2]SDA75553.1 hypothetical protein SAMN03159429_03540 [Pseudomonas sp. NFACC51]SEJ31210.1 hypothetical protein SAMN03159298_02761 [Pseudomonas sp. NFACC07-1]SFH43523.1 hypothetical protein SAMN03159302_01534 [Pseudomonas sp. NFACC54]SFT15432.1 hypothetical protein SAMN03159306_04070 [Pseudomonas sp. NFACC48-1]